MSGAGILLCGRAFGPEELARFEGLGVIGRVAGPAGIGALEAGARDAVRALALKASAPFGAAEMDLLPGLELIAVYGVGYDNVDVATATARGIRVTNTPDVLSDDVADMAVMLLLAQARGLLKGDDWVRSGRWAAEGPMPLMRKLGGVRAGIVGLGRIGREIADRLAAFKMEIHYHSRAEKRTPPGWRHHGDVVALARAVDVLVVALVGGPETENYVSAEAIAALGPKGILINISRGSTVDEAALIAALEAGQLAGAGLDVFWNEPNVDRRLTARGDVVLQPHHASGTVETRAAMAQLQFDNMAAFVTGRPLLTPVN